jgi:hypothetical protein
MIELLTEKVCGKNKAIVDIPIVLVIYSPHCPDLTIIDLPGITRISIEDQAQVGLSLDFQQSVSGSKKLGHRKAD